MPILAGHDKPSPFRKTAKMILFIHCIKVEFFGGSTALF